jgi:phage/plasmid-associated DNA primase
VREATDSYFADQDTLQQWLDECTQDGGFDAFTHNKDLFASWKEWCEARNYRPGSSTLLSEQLLSRGYTKKREAGSGQRGFTNVILKTR